MMAETEEANASSNYLDNSYVFVSGADGLPQSCNVSAELDVESGKISDDPQSTKEGLQVSVADSLVEQHTGKTESSSEKYQVEQVEDPDINIQSFTEEEEEAVDVVGDRNGNNDDGEKEKFDQLTKSSDSAHGFVENQGSRIGVSDLVAGSGESDESNDISSALINSSGNANGEYGNQVKLSAFETWEACQGSHDVVVCAVVCELLDVSVAGAAEDEVKLAGEAVEAHEVDMELNPINTKEERDVVEDVVDVSVKAEDKVKLSGQVVETAKYEVLPSTSVDLESNPINSKEETDVVEDVFLCELKIVTVRPEDEIQLSREVVETAQQEILPSNSLDSELNPINTEEETDVVEDVVQPELQDVRVEAEDEVKLAKEVVETCEHEIPPSTSVDLGLESSPINTKEETDVVVNVFMGELQSVSVKAEDEIKLPGEVVETAEHEIPLPTSLDLDLDLESTQINTKEEIDVVMDIVECELQDQSMKPGDDAKLSGEVVQTAEYEIPQLTSLDLDLALNPIITKEETGMVGDVVECESQDVSVKSNDEIKLSVKMVETIELEISPSTSLDLDLESTPINTKEEIDVVEDVVQCELQDQSMKGGDEVNLSGDMNSYPINTKEEKDVVVEVVECESQDVSLKAKDEVRLLEEVVKTAEHEVPLSAPLDLESNPINSKEEISVIVNVAECELQDASLKAEDKVKLLGEVVEIAEHEVPSLTSHVTLEPEVHVHNSSAYRSGENSGDVTNTCRTDVSDCSNVNKEGATNIGLEIEDVEEPADQIDGAAGSSNENLFLRENEDTENSQDNNAPAASPRGSRANMIDVEEASIKTKRKPFNFLIRVPRFDNESLREQIRLAKLNIDEKTKLRDAIQVQIQEKRASSQIHGIDYEYAKGEGRNARKLVRSKRMEIDSLQSVINKAKNALSIEDIDNQIYNMEHMIQHETLPLKEEKQLIREIKQLKQLREQLSYNMGSEDEIKQALEQREEVGERLKILRKELDILKDKVLKAEAAAVEAEKKYDDENKKVRELQAQFRAADDVRQAAYVQWQCLRKELSKKSEHFFKYKDDAAVASNYVFSRNTEALYRLCTNNVENFMELWNTNDEFRREYVKFNARSTVRRLGTLDGRLLGPNEEPPVLPSYVDERVNNRIISTPVKVDLASQFPTLELKQERGIESVTSDGKLMRKMMEEKNQKVTNKGASISMQVNGSDTVSGLDITHEVHEEPKKSREEIEAIKKAEEKKRKEAEAKLKEERRLEALAKANEARERKKRQAEKLQMRAELKTLKEAEQKEKEREKRLRKKERKKAAATDVNDINNSEFALSSESAAESSKDIDVKDVSSSSSSVAAKKPKKHWLFGKQGKAKSIPPPLRNRNKKKLQQWMWVGITSIAILVLFWLVNIGVFSNVNFKRRSPAL